MNKKLDDYFEQKQRECGARLKSERIRIGFGLSEFATRAGVHRNTQRNYENGTREPDAEYCKAAAALGVDMLFVFDGATISDLPARAGQIAKLIFSRHQIGVDPDSMTALFYLLSLNNISESIPDDGALLTESHINKLIKIAFERGEVFYEAFSAVSSYFFGMLRPEPSALDNCRLWVDLIFKTVSVYDANKDSLHLSTHDSIRLAAEGVLKRYSTKKSAG